MCVQLSHMNLIKIMLHVCRRVSVARACRISHSCVRVRVYVCDAIDREIECENKLEYQHGLANEFFCRKKAIRV